MAGSNLKSVQITNLDASYVKANTWNPGTVRVARDYVTPASSDDNTSTYKLVRIPSNATIIAVYLMSAIASAGSGDVDIAYSDSTTDGTQPAFQGLVPGVPSTANKLFGAAQSLVLSSARTDFTYKGTFLPKHQNMELWAVLVDVGCTAFTADPGGFFDIHVVITTTVTTGGVLAGEVWYTD